jgi:hypothetical protein
MKASEVVIWSLDIPHGMELRIVIVDRCFFYGYGERGKDGGWVVNYDTSPEEARHHALLATQRNEKQGGVLAQEPRVHDFKDTLPPLYGPNAHQTAEYLYKTTLYVGTKLTA